MKIAMAEIVAGSPEALRQRPFAINYINISNPLRQNPDSLEKLMWLSEKGLPFVYRPSIITRGISTPITWAGFLVVNNVAGLAGLVLSQQGDRIDRLYVVQEGLVQFRFQVGPNKFWSVDSSMVVPPSRAGSSSVPRIWISLGLT